MSDELETKTVEETVVEQPAQPVPEETTPAVTEEVKPAEEPKEELKAEEKPVEEIKEELKAPEVKEEPNLQEQLSLIREVRTELAKTYAESKIIKEENEALKLENQKVKNEFDTTAKKLEELSAEVQVFRARDEEANKIAYNKRLEKLSMDFKELGQIKTVEELSSKDLKVIEELEAVVSIAMTTKAKEPLNSVVTPTQAIPRAVKKKSEPLTHNQFLNALGKQLESAEKKY